MTRDERREVAARLRELVADWFDDGEFYDRCEVEDVLGLATDDGAWYEAAGVRRLADLIEPEERTCHDVSFDSREFVCSWCGCHIDVLGIESEPTMWLGGSPIEPSFCPNCGAKVIQE